MTFKDFFSIKTKSILSLVSMRKMLEEKLKDKERVRDIEIALTNKKTNEVLYVKNKSKEIMITSVLASSSLSYVFSPIKIDKIKYKDGGYSNNLPYINFHKDNYLTLAVSTDYKNSNAKKKMINKLYCGKIKYPDLEPDYLLKVKHIHKITTFELTKVEFIMKVGYRQAKRDLDINEIRKKLI